MLCSWNPMLPMKSSCWLLRYPFLLAKIWQNHAKIESPLLWLWINTCETPHVGWITSHKSQRFWCEPSAVQRWMGTPMPAHSSGDQRWWCGCLDKKHLVLDHSDRKWMKTAAFNPIYRFFSDLNMVMSHIAILGYINIKLPEGNIWNYRLLRLWKGQTHLDFVAGRKSWNVVTRSLGSPKMTKIPGINPLHNRRIGWCDFKAHLKIGKIEDHRRWWNKLNKPSQMFKWCKN